MNPLTHSVQAARAGNLDAFADLVEATQAMAYAVAWRIVRSEADARDIVQEAYLIAFRRLADLGAPEAFAGWLRRVLITTALNHRRRARPLWIPLEEPIVPPFLDADEERWTRAQQGLLSRALLTLNDEERRLCELRYYGGRTAEQIAHAAGVAPVAIRKRLQRIRDQLRQEIEMDERRQLGSQRVPDDMPAHIVELLARPRLVDLPENPVAETAATLRTCFPGFSEMDLPEQIDLAQAQTQLGADAVYIDRAQLQRVEGERILRYDLTLPLLLTFRWSNRPTKLTAAGKVYRVEHESATRLEAFHQLELFAIDAREALDAWWLAGRILAAVDRLLPGAEVRVTPTSYPMCERAWSLDVRRDAALASRCGGDDAEAPDADGEWTEIMAWGQYAEWVVRAVGADPRRQVALGAGFGLERCAALRYGIDDVRKMANARVA